MEADVQMSAIVVTTKIGVEAVACLLMEYPGRAVFPRLSGLMPLVGVLKCLMR